MGFWEEGRLAERTETDGGVFCSFEDDDDDDDDGLLDRMEEVGGFWASVGERLDEWSSGCGAKVEL